MKLFNLFTLSLFAAMLVVSVATAQMDSCNVFLKGNHVEIGISPSGSYGSSCIAPSGYHPNINYSGNLYRPCSGGSTSGNYLGFVADPGLTGWDTAHAGPHYWGDYFLPGDPFEGWGIQIGTLGQDQAFNTTGAAGFTGTLTGSNISYSSSGGVLSSTWQGMDDSVQITQVTTLDTGALFFTVNITLTNLSVTARDNIYYLHSLDPDNEEPWTSNFITDNIIEHQCPDSLNATVVSAAGLTSALSYLALGTTDTNSRAFIYNAWPLAASVDLSAVYNATWTSGGATYTVGWHDTADASIGLVMKVAHLATVDSAADSVARTTSAMLHPANSQSFGYFFAFGKPAVDSALAHLSHTTTGTLAITNVNTPAMVQVYPNPARSTIHVTGLTAGDQVAIYDMMGRQVRQPMAATGNGADNFAVQDLATGNYILVVSDAQGALKARVPVSKN